MEDRKSKIKEDLQNLHGLYEIMEEKVSHMKANHSFKLFGKIKISKGRIISVAGITFIYVLRAILRKFFK